jgi:hypothetical protein
MPNEQLHHIPPPTSLRGDDGMADYKFVTYHTNSIRRSEMEGPERFIRFAFEKFTPSKKEPRAELYLDGELIASKGTAHPTPERG